MDEWSPLQGNKFQWHFKDSKDFLCDGLSTISRCGLNATFKVPVFSFVSTFLRLIAPENYAQLLILQEFWQFFINMPQVKKEWFCAPYVGWHLCGLMLHLWSPLHSLGTFLAPMVYLPWKTNECYLKAYSLIDFAITLPDGVGVMIDFEVAMRAAWTELQRTHHVPGCLFHLTQVLKPWVEM